MSITDFNTFSESSRVRILRAINAANPGLGLSLDEVMFSPPEWSHDPDGDRYNSKVQVVATRESDRVGRFYWYYHRQSFAAVFGTQTPKLRFTPDRFEKKDGFYILTADDIAQVLFEQYNVRLEGYEIAAPLGGFSDLTPHHETSITVSSDSLGFTGHARFLFTFVESVLDSTVTNTLGDIGYVGNDAKAQAEIYFGPKRETRQALVDRWMDENPTVNAPLSGLMIDAIRNLFGSEWNSTPGTETDFNLADATIAYFGSNGPEQGIPGHSGDQLVYVRLSALCSNFDGFLLIVLPSHQVQAWRDKQPTP